MNTALALSMAAMAAATSGGATYLARPPTEPAKPVMIEMQRVPDPATGCVYLAASGVGITPLLDKAGRPNCGGAA